MRAALSIFVAAMVCVGAVAAVAPDCPLPPVLQALPAGIDIFSETQESDLGDAMAEQIGHGQTGNWLSDFLEATKPEQRRLREVIRGMTALPVRITNDLLLPLCE